MTGLMGLVENLPSGTSYKPGDVIRSRSGKTIEVLNTDAEGRLVLADLLNYAGDLEADHVVDLATLTGACMVALGDGVSGVMGIDQKLVERILDAGSRSGEYLWQLPLVEEYREALKSQVARPQEHHRHQVGRGHQRRPVPEGLRQDRVLGPRGPVRLLVRIRAGLPARRRHRRGTPLAPGLDQQLTSGFEYLYIGEGHWTPNVNR